MGLNGRKLREYDEFSERDLEGDRTCGREDAEKGLPHPAEPEFTGHQFQLLQKARGDLTGFAKELQEAQDEVGNRINEKERDKGGYNNRRGDLIGNREKELQRLREEKGEDSSVFKDTKATLESIGKQLQKVRDELKGRPLRSYISRRKYAVVFFLLAVCELPINLPAAQAVFRESLLFAFVIAAMVGAIVMYFAHQMGRLTRQHTVLAAQGRQLHWITIIFITVMSLAIIGAVFKLRLDFMRDEGPGGAAAPMESAIFFLLINISIFLTGFLLSLFHHDAHPDYQVLTDKLEKAQARFQAIQKAHEDARAEILVRYDYDDASLKSEIERLDGEIAAARASSDNLDIQKGREVDLVLAVTGRRIAAYQSTNRQVRGAPLPPPPHFTQAAVQAQLGLIRAEFVQ